MKDPSHDLPLQSTVGGRRNVHDAPVAVPVSI
jgi:hypothetical protein